MSKTWHWELSKTFGPVFMGMTLGQCLRLYYQNRFRIAPASFPRALSTLFRTATISPVSWYEKIRYGRVVRNIEILPPIFILGHWRGGTTHLHNLLSLDKRFAYPSLFEVTNPLTFLSTRKLGWLFKYLVPPKRPFDNMKLELNMPYEDEFVAWQCMGLSSYVSWNFPKSAAYYDRFLTFRDATSQEIQRWKNDQILFMKKLTWLYQKPLILKSPQHTCRIKLLLSMFPHAKFIHIHRNPYTVFLSTRKLNQTALELVSLQKYDLNQVDARIISQYAEMYDAFLEEQPLIPKGQFCELNFAELERHPVTMLGDIYSALDLPPFKDVKPNVEAYLQTLSTYKKNRHPDIDVDTRRRIQNSWEKYFLKWGYEL